MRCMFQSEAWHGVLLPVSKTNYYLFYREYNIFISYFFLFSDNNNYCYTNGKYYMYYYTLVTI